MIACLQGELFVKTAEKVIVLVGGVGYEVFATGACLARLPEIGHSVFLHVHTHVREDAIILYGFSNEEEKETFLLLIGVSGIGPKLALTILSGISPAEFASAIAQEQIHTLVKLPGVGKKTAERLCLELKDKVQWIPQHYDVHAPTVAEVANDVAGDAVSALMNLGYPQGKAEEAVQQAVAHSAEPNRLTLEELIRHALRVLA